MATFSVLYDACVLYPAPLRDLLLQLALTGHFRARWTDRIHDEWIRSLLERRPELEQQLRRTRELMDEAVPGCLVTGYEVLMAGLELPDPDDRHVLAAAVRANVVLIITSNMKDFPEPYLRELGIRAQHPDDFIFDLIDLAPEAVIEAVRTVRLRLKKPPIEAADYILTLERQGLVKTVSMLKSAINLL